MCFSKHHTNPGDLRSAQLIMSLLQLHTGPQIRAWSNDFLFSEKLVSRLPFRSGLAFYCAEVRPVLAAVHSRRCTLRFRRQSPPLTPGKPSGAGWRLRTLGF